MIGRDPSNTKHRQRPSDGNGEAVENPRVRLNGEILKGRTRERKKERMKGRAKKRKWIRQRFKTWGSMKLSPSDEPDLQDGVATDGRYGPSKETDIAVGNTSNNETQDSGAEETAWKGKEDAKPSQRARNQRTMRRVRQKPSKTAKPSGRSDGKTSALAGMVRRDEPSLRIGGQCEESRRRLGGRKQRRRGTAERTGSGHLGLHSITEQPSWCTRGG